MEQCEQITRMEQILDGHAEKLEQLETLLDYFQDHLAEYAALCDYYYSDQRHKDLEDDAAGRIPQDLKRGVLSEDGIYNFCLDYHESAIRMMEVALAMLKNN